MYAIRSYYGLVYPITVQYIVYDEVEKKVRKEDWLDYSKNPRITSYNVCYTKLLRYTTTTPMNTVH